MTDKSKRLILVLAALFSWGLVLFAWQYLEKTLFLMPCPLCMMQRVAFVLIGIFFMLEAICWPRRPLAAFILRIGKYLSVFFGIGLAARHLYIQSLPPGQTPACGFDFWGTLSHNGFWGGIWQSMQGTGECATPDKFLGFTIPMWSMAAFFILLIIAILCTRRKDEDYL